MKTILTNLLLALVSATLHAALPTDEAGAIAYLGERGVTINMNADGHAVTLMSTGKPVLAAEEYALIGKLTQLEVVGINGAPLADDEWAFLKSLPKLKQLSIWHCAGFASLEPFSGLPVESLTIGGCMGLRDKNKGDEEKLRHTLTTLHDLPNLTKGNWYHSPLAPDDSHLAHIAAQFPKLTVLRLENVPSFTAEHFQAIAGIKSLKTLTVDARKQSANEEAIAAFSEARPDVEVAVSQPGDKGPPQVKSK